jgi:hypothetical protein
LAGILLELILILAAKGVVAMAKPSIKPGQTVPDSGIYVSSKSGQRITIVKGEPAPPTPQKGETWKQKVDTNPKK